MIQYKVHRQLYLYLIGSRDAYWIEEGDTIIITQTKNGWCRYETEDGEYTGTFREIFLDEKNSYYDWLKDEYGF